MKRTMNLRIASLLALTMAVAAGCATSPDDEQPGEDRLVTIEQKSEADPAVVPAGVPSPFSSVSFWQTCFSPKGFVVDMSNGAVVFAFADGGCRRFNGSIGGATSWSGTCFGDVSNCNGRIVCQNHCP